MSTQYITSLARAEAMLSLEGALDALSCFQMDLTDLCEELDRATKNEVDLQLDLAFDRLYALHVLLEGCVIRVSVGPFDA